MCRDYIGDWCLGDYGASDAGYHMNPSMYLGHDNWLVTSGISSMTVAPYDPVVRGAVVFHSEPDCTGHSAAFYAHEDPSKKIYYNQA